MTATEALLLLAAGVLSGFINVMSAGGSMLTLPLLMFMGLDSATANGSNRVGIVLQNITAMGQYHSAGFRDLRLGLKLSLPAVAGALLGAWIAIGLDERLFRWILILVMGGCAVLMLLPMPRGLHTRPLDEGHLGYRVYLALALIGLYGGFIQVAVGILFITLLYRVLHIDLVQVNRLKVLIVLVYMVPALAIFIAGGKVAWGYGLVLALGSMLGAWFGARLSISPGGVKWIKWLTLVMIVAIIGKLGFDLLY
ncbi:sulfite exporter TauE/SafE family protein [Zobellella endophytica]|uniref:Probable membrane transporter protein n=1 Tax=Zobellella endophytica TaxID=2116700 RepID=A0A2P7R5Y5_9GAMM|nr:sulfite exporter TauE/SafE family protein [Zobellella endophytica]PSJ45625.1 sulfite exporter TauE/SafE family protein [Zobellella endophytica]